MTMFGPTNQYIILCLSLQRRMCPLFHCYSKQTTSNDRLPKNTWIFPNGCLVASGLSLVGRSEQSTWTSFVSSGERSLSAGWDAKDWMWELEDWLNTGSKQVKILMMKPWLGEDPPFTLKKSPLVSACFGTSPAPCSNCNSDQQNHKRNIKAQSPS